MVACARDQILAGGKCVDIPDYYTDEDAFFGSKEARLRFTAHAEETLLRAFSTNMKTGDYTKMTVELQEVLRNDVLKEDTFCFSGYHHTVMLLSALADRLHRGPREHLFIALQGKNGLDHSQGHSGQTNNDLVSDTLIRIDAVQRDFGESRSYQIFQGLKKIFPLVTKFSPPLVELAGEIDRAIRVPKGYVYEGCHFGVKSKRMASFEGQSRFFRDDMTLRPDAGKDDDVVTRWQTKSDGRAWKRDYFVFLNVALKLRRGRHSLHFHVPIRIVSFAVLNSEFGKWIRPQMVQLPRFGAKIYSATMFTIFRYFLYAFNSTQLYLAGSAAALHMLQHVHLSDLDRAITTEDVHVLAPLYESKKMKELTKTQRRQVFVGMRKTADALMASCVLQSSRMHRINFISPETIEGG